MEEDDFDILEWEIPKLDAGHVDKLVDTSLIDITGENDVTITDEEFEDANWTIIGNAPDGDWDEVPDIEKIEKCDLLDETNFEDYDNFCDISFNIDATNGNGSKKFDVDNSTENIDGKTNVNKLCKHFVIDDRTVEKVNKFIENTEGYVVIDEVECKDDIGLRKGNFEELAHSLIECGEAESNHHHDDMSAELAYQLDMYEKEQSYEMETDEYCNDPATFLSGDEKYDYFPDGFVKRKKDRYGPRSRKKQRRNAFSDRNYSFSSCYHYY